MFWCFFKNCENNWSYEDKMFLFFVVQVLNAFMDEILLNQLCFRIQIFFNSLALNTFWQHAKHFLNNMCDLFQ